MLMREVYRIQFLRYKEGFIRWYGSGKMKKNKKQSGFVQGSARKPIKKPAKKINYKK